MLVHSGMYVRKFIATFFIVGFVLTALAACGQQSSGSSNTITIGATAPMTGDGSADGKALKQGYDLWAEAVNQRGGLLGHHVVMDIKDDQTKPEVTKTLYTSMVSSHDDLLFGPFGEEATKAGADVAKNNGYPFVEGAGNSTWIFQQKETTLFSVSLSAAKALTSFSNYILSLPKAAGKTLSAYYSTSTDAFTKPQVDNARTLLEKGHVDTLGYDQFPAENIDYDALAQKIVAAKPDVVVLGTLGQSDAVAIMKHFKQQNFNPLAIVATAGPDQGDQFTGPLGGPQAARDTLVPNGGWFPESNSYQNTAFVKAYLAKYTGTLAANISSDTVQAYSVGQVMEQAVNKAQSLDHAKLIQTLKTNSFDSLQGPVKFSADGQNTTATAFLFQWQGGTLIPVFPADVAKKNPELNHYFDLPPSPNYNY